MNLVCKDPTVRGLAHMQVANSSLTPPPQAELVMGASADALAALRKGGDEEGFKAALKAARWQSWVMNVQARPTRAWLGARRGARGPRSAETTAGCPARGASARKPALTSSPKTHHCNPQARSREYNGERRMRYTVMQVGALEGRPLLWGGYDSVVGRRRAHVLRRDAGTRPRAARQGRGACARRRR